MAMKKKAKKKTAKKMNKKKMMAKKKKTTKKKASKKKMTAKKKTAKKAAKKTVARRQPKKMGKKKVSRNTRPKQSVKTNPKTQEESPKKPQSYGGKPKLAPKKDAPKAGEGVEGLSMSSGRRKGILALKRARAVKGGSLRDRFKAELGKGGDDKGSIDGADIKAYEAMRAAAGARQARRKVDPKNMTFKRKALNWVGKKVSGGRPMTDEEKKQKGKKYKAMMGVRG